MRHKSYRFCALALIVFSLGARPAYGQKPAQDLSAPAEAAANAPISVDALHQRIDAQSAQLEMQQRELQELRARIEALSMQGADEQNAEQISPGLTEEQVKKVVDDYLEQNPGVGMPPGVQTGFGAGQGFYIRSPPNPPYVKWEDQSRIPFELRVRGRVQLDYYDYNVNDNLNHLTGNRYSPSVGDFSQLEVKRFRLIFEGNAYSPNLRYQFQFDGNTRGLGGFQGNRVVQTAGSPPGASYGAPGIGGAASTIGGGDVVDHAVRLFTAWVAYDAHLRDRRYDSPDGGTYDYTPVLTFIGGKQQPFFGFTEILGSANGQLVDFAMADWFFDADDNNMLTAAAAQYRDFNDRLFATAMLTNGNESQFPNTLMDNLPGLISGFWYDFGGSWDKQAKRWQLYGNSLSDLDYSTAPTVRIGASSNLVPMGRRSIYGDIEQSRVLVTPGGPGGSRLINVLNGDSVLPLGSHAVDKFNSYSFDVWASGHYRGFSFTNEWWLRDLNGFATTPPGGNLIVYQDGSGANAIFPNHSLIDFGTLVQAGYFVIPKKLEIVSRYSMVSGDSGDINGSGRFTTVQIPGIATPVRVIAGAFSHFHTANEIAVGFNYFYFGQMAKWSTDFSIYQGGNPAAGGASPAGYIAGVDGWLLRTQLQVAF